MTSSFIKLLQCATAEPDGQKRALVIGGGIANFTDVAATFNGIIRALKEKVGFVAHRALHILWYLLAQVNTKLRAVRFFRNQSLKLRECTFM